MDVAGVRPGSSPRVMLQPLKPPNSQGFSVGSDSTDDKEYIAQLKREIRLLANKVSEYAVAVETDRRMGDSSSLLRRPLTPGSANRPGTSGGQASVGQIAGNIDTFIEKASAAKGFEQVSSLHASTRTYPSPARIHTSVPAHTLIRRRYFSQQHYHVPCH